MPWKECSAVSCREEFVGLAQADWAKMSELCRRFGVSRKTGYKWLRRYASAGVSGLLDRSRRPRGSPGRTSEAMEGRVLAIRTEHPAWGGRKIRRVLLNAGHQDVPSASTITAILHRHGLIDEAESSKHKAWMRFEHERPNDLWQMDFKGHFAMDRDRCHPLTVLDDHSRYCVGLQACGNERTGTVRERLTGVFRRYGLPRRTLKAEVLSGRSFENLLACQNAFDDWRETYNVRRPHEALELNTPITRYAVSNRGVLYAEVCEGGCRGVAACLYFIIQGVELDGFAGRYGLHDRAVCVYIGSGSGCRVAACCDPREVYVV